MGAIEPPVWGNCGECGARTDVRMIAKCEPCLKAAADRFFALWDAEEARKKAAGSDTIRA